MAVLDENGLSHLWSKAKEFFSTKDHTHNVFVKSGSDAKEGFVPAPPTTAGTAKYLREDGTWATPPNTQTKTGASSTTSKIFLVGAIEQTGVAQTYTKDSVFVSAGGNLYSGGEKVLTGSDIEDLELDVNIIKQSYAKKSDITGVYKYKGSVANASSLPTDASVGDVYDIQSASVYGSAGANVAWNGTAWDSLGEIFSVDSITNTQIDEICV